MSLTVIKIPLAESKHTTHVAYSRLSTYAKKLIQLMAEVYAATNKNNFSLNYLRQYPQAGNWRDVRDGFYELESRALGTVRSDGPELFFSAYIPIMQSVGKLTEAIDIPDALVPDEDEFGDVVFGMLSTDAHKNEAADIIGNLVEDIKDLCVGIENLRIEWDWRNGSEPEAVDESYVDKGFIFHYAFALFTDPSLPHSIVHRLYVDRGKSTIALYWA